MQEKVLVIGAGINQVPIIKKLKENGYYVISVTPNGDYPGIALSDEVYYENILNKEKILFFARNIDIVGVVSDLSDIATPTVAYVSEKLGLPSFGYNNSLIFTDKSKMRLLYKKLELPCVESITTNSIEEAKRFIREIIGYPIIIKPVDSYSSRGVFRIYDEKELNENFSVSLKCSLSKKVIIERLIEGKQFFSQGFVKNGKLNLFAFSNRDYFNIDKLCIPYDNIFPAQIKEPLKNKMIDYFDKIINHLRPDFGIVWAEWILDDISEELYIIEMAIRGAGADVTTDIIPLAYGIDLEECLIKAATNKAYSIDDNIHNVKAAGFISFLLPKGRIIKITGSDKLNNISGVYKINLKNIKVGDYIDKWEDKNSRMGMIIIFADNIIGLQDVKKQVIETLSIEVLTDEGIQNIIWE